MIDLPQQPAVVHECVVETQNLSKPQNLEITDLSFYNVLAAGMCSGSSSSGPVDNIIASSVAVEEKS